MKMMKRISAVICAAALAGSLAACGGGGGGDAGTAVTDAAKKASEAKSMEATMVMDMNIKVEAAGQSQEMLVSTTADMVSFMDPVEKHKVDMKMLMDIGMGSPEEQTVSMFMVKDADGGYVLCTDNGMGSWTSSTIATDAAAQYNPQSSLDLYVKNADSFKKGAEETINDEKATKYTGVIGKDSIKEVLDASGMGESLGQFGLDESMDWDTLTASMADMPIAIWINEAGYPVKYEMDMTELVNSLFKNLMEQMGDAASDYSMSCDTVLMSMVMSNYDAATDFELPEDVQAIVGDTDAAGSADVEETANDEDAATAEENDDATEETAGDADTAADDAEANADDAAEDDTTATEDAAA